MAIINNNYHPKKWESVYRRVSMIFISYFIIFPGISRCFNGSFYIDLYGVCYNIFFGLALSKKVNASALLLPLFVQQEACTSVFCILLLL
jgi:hypothetical protein